MLQRIQSIYLLLAVVCAVLCMCMPIGYFNYEDGAEVARAASLYNLYASVPSEVVGQFEHTFTPWVALFVVLALVATMHTLAIFLFKRRALQMRLTNLANLVLIGYYIAGVVFVLMANNESGTSFRPTLWAALPLVALILGYMAFRAILKDEMLVRSLDRLR